MLAHAEEAFVQHVQQLDDTRLLADIDEADESFSCAHASVHGLSSGFRTLH
jgi:hypothetical protein